MSIQLVGPPVLDVLVLVLVVVVVIVVVDGFVVQDLQERAQWMRSETPLTV